MNRDSALVYVFCEGLTEEGFVRTVLAPHFRPMRIWVKPLLIRTGAQGEGGVTNYAKISGQIRRQCKADSTATVTTMLDFYALPNDFPAMKTRDLQSIQLAKTVAAAFEKDIGMPNFIANLVVHEFEGLLFSAPEAFSIIYKDRKVIAKLEDIRRNYASPEHINDGRASAPSKRIAEVCRRYKKVLYGTLIAEEIGLDGIRRECPLFDGWVKRLETSAMA